GGHGGGTPFEFALVAEDDVFETFEEIGREFGHKSGFANHAIAEDDVALEDADAAFANGELAGVFDDFSDVVQEAAAEGEIGIDFLVKREETFADSGHVNC